MRVSVGDRRGGDVYGRGGGHHGRGCGRVCVRGWGVFLVLCLALKTNATPRKSSCKSFLESPIKYPLKTQKPTIPCATHNPHFAGKPPDFPDATARRCDYGLHTLWTLLSNLNWHSDTPNEYPKANPNINTNGNMHSQTCTTTLKAQQPHLNQHQYQHQMRVTRSRAIQRLYPIKNRIDTETGEKRRNRYPTSNRIDNERKHPMSPRMYHPMTTLRAGSNQPAMIKSYSEMLIDQNLKDFLVPVVVKGNVQMIGHHLTKRLVSILTKSARESDVSTITENHALKAINTLKVDPYCSEFVRTFNNSKESLKKALKKRKLSYGTSSILGEDEGNTKPIEDMTESEKLDLYRRANEYAQKREKINEEAKKNKEREKQRLKDEKKERIKGIRALRKAGLQEQKHKLKLQKENLKIHKRKERVAAKAKKGRGPEKSKVKKPDKPKQEV